MRSHALDAVAVPEIGKYHLIAELAHGGMGVIHLAVAHGPAGFNKLLVVKELKPELARDDAYVAMFLEEARLAARLQHKNIVQTNEVGSEGPRHYMVMEFLDGRSLSRVARKCAEKGRFPLSAHLRVIAEMLVGLHYAHDLKDFDGQPLGVVHRDVSPLNVFVTFDGQVKVIDFGIAKTADSSVETKTGTLKGRVAYMAPEQAWGSKVDRRADVYSAGVMLWEAIAGRRLWPGMSEVEILARILREGAPPLSSVLPDAPEDLEAICARAMERSPDDRYPTAADLLEDLEAHLKTRDDTMTMREVGALVATTFAEERTRMTEVIEETLTRLRSGPRSGVQPTVVPRFDIPFSGTPSNRAPRDEPSYASAQLVINATSSVIPAMGSMPLTPFATPLVPPAPVMRPRFGSKWLSSAVQGGSRRLALAGVGAGALVAGIVAAVFAFHDGSSGAPDPLAAGAVTAAAPTPAGVAAAEPQLVDVVVRVSPPSAQITIDGAPVATNPFHARFPRDAQVHHVLVSADGYDPKMEDVSFSGDVSIDVSLDHRAPAHASAPVVVVRPAPPPVAPPPARAAKHASAPVSTPPPDPPAPSSPPPPARQEVSPSGGRPPLRPIQTSNPYGGQ